MVEFRKREEPPGIRLSGIRIRGKVYRTFTGVNMIHTAFLKETRRRESL